MRQSAMLVARGQCLTGRGSWRGQLTLFAALLRWGFVAQCLLSGARPPHAGDFGPLVTAVTIDRGVKTGRLAELSAEEAVLQSDSDGTTRIATSDLLLLQSGAP